MNAFDQKDKFNELSNKIGIYQAVNQIASNARSLSEKYEHHISESESITWALTGKKPKSALQYELRKQQKRHIDTLSAKYAKSVVDDYLALVSDMGVCKSVRASVKASNESKSEVFVYIDVDDCESRHSRVRVLTRMILDTLWSRK